MQLLEHLLAVLFIFTIVVLIFTPVFILIFAPGFYIDPAKKRSFYSSS